MAKEKTDKKKRPLTSYPQPPFMAGDPTNYDAYRELVEPGPLSSSEKLPDKDKS
ncbi:MAG: hypothetical protein ACOY40_05965 [Bacillota bacterium]